MCEEVEAVCMVVISHGKKCGVAVEVEKGYPGAFYHCSAWYVWERDWKWTEADMLKPIFGS